MIWLGGAYFENRLGAFRLGLGISLSLLILCHFWFRLSALGTEERGRLLADAVILELLMTPEPTP